MAASELAHALLPFLQTAACVIRPMRCRIEDDCFRAAQTDGFFRQHKNGFAAYVMPTRPMNDSHAAFDLSSRQICGKFTLRVAIDL